MRAQRIVSNNDDINSKYQTLPKLNRVVTSRLPVLEGEFKVHIFKDYNDETHLALVMGSIRGKKNILVRVHSECLTGDAFGSIRCDCGEQLRQSIQIMIEEGSGAILYLRQEGRGIGLISKLRAYNLQDNGYDTVDANIALGHEPDERDYEIAALILKDLGVDSIRLLSNNPSKLKPLIDLGIKIPRRIPLKPRVTSENASYLKTKISRMNHILDMDALSSTTPERESIIRDLSRKIKNFQNNNRPFVTISYAQSLDGFISTSRNRSMTLSGEESLILTHQIRAIHDVILVGISTIISDNPQLNVRLAKGKNPQPIILDTNLKFPLESKLLRNNSITPWIITGEQVDMKKQRILEDYGARVYRLPSSKDRIELSILLQFLVEQGIKSVMVEGGARVISSFIEGNAVDQIVATIVPLFIGDGLRALEQTVFNNAKVLYGKDELLSFECLRYIQLGRDLIIYGKPSWKNSK